MLVRELKLEEFLADVARSQTKIRLGNKFIEKKVIKGQDEDGKDIVEFKKEENESYDNLDFVLSKLLDYMELFNSIGEFDQMILGVKIDDIPVLNEFEWTLIPRLSRLDVGNYWTTSLLIYEDRVEESKSIAEYNMLINHWRRFFKRDATSDITTLGNVKKSVNLSEILPKICCGKRVTYEDKAFSPIKIDAKCVKGLFQQEYFNTSAQFVLERFISELSFTK